MGLREAMPFINFSELYKGSKETKEVIRMYDVYCKNIDKENECYKKTAHRNQKWIGVFGSYVCLDCGADYV